MWSRFCGNLDEFCNPFELEKRDTEINARENLIEQTVKNGAESICNKCFHGKVCRAMGNQPCVGCNQFVDANGVTVQKWIPVTERLPEKAENVLALTESKMGQGDYVSWLTWYDPTKRAFYEYDSTWGDVRVRDVTHWMPLPEPPKEATP